MKDFYIIYMFYDSKNKVMIVEKIIIFKNNVIIYHIFIFKIKYINNFFTVMIRKKEREKKNQFKPCNPNIQIKRIQLQ